MTQPTDKNMPDVIYAVGKSCDLTRDFEDITSLWSHKPSWNNCQKYIRADCEAFARVQEALEFYANEDNYAEGFIKDDDGRTIGTDESRTSSDEGHRAGEALAIVKRMRGGE